MAKWNSHFMWWSQVLRKSIEKAVTLMWDGIWQQKFSMELNLVNDKFWNTNLEHLIQKQITFKI